MVNHSSLIMKISLITFFIVFLVNAELFAQNLLITDYKVPVSSASSLLIDVNGNYEMSGSELTTNISNISGVYRSFYDSLPYAYSFDWIGNFSRRMDENDYNTDLEARLKKYIWEDENFFGSVKLHSSYSDNYERIPVDMTFGLGYGRFVNVTPLAKAARIEGFWLREGILKDDLPAETMIDFGQLIERESEYKNKYGDVYKVHWYKDISNLIEKSGMLKKKELDAIGILRMDEVLFRQRVNDRFYGWDATLGAKIELLTSSKEIERQSPAADITIRYSRPINWRAQWNERLSVNSPANEEFTKVYDLTMNSDFSYEMTNRINFTLNHLLTVDKASQDTDALITNSLRISFIFFIENYVNLVTSMNFYKTSETELNSSFTLSLNYRVF